MASLPEIPTVDDSIIIVTKVETTVKNETISTSFVATTAPKDLRHYQNASALDVRTQLLGGKSSCIWDFSDNSAWFISGLYHNNPLERRKKLETLVKGSGDSIHSQASIPKKASKKRVKITTSVPVLHLPTKTFPVDDAETSEVIQRTIELTTDMLKSVEIIYHALRACAKFLSFPTPSIPSDNYVFGQVRGWIWLIYKGIFSLAPTPANLEKSVSMLHKDLGLLAREIREVIKSCKEFNSCLKKLQKDFEKEIKYLKNKGGIWELKMAKYFTYLGKLANKTDVLVETQEDRYFGSDWLFEPEEMIAKGSVDFLHFQWIRMDKDIEFEVRSDYSKRWLPFTKFDWHLQMEMIRRMIIHLTAMIVEAKKFNNFHLHLNFDYAEFRCLKISVNTLAKKKGNNYPANALLANIILEFVQEYANLAELSARFQVKMMEMSNLMVPLYNTVKKWSRNVKVIPLYEEETSHKLNKTGCCGRGNKKDFLELYGTPMRAVLMRTPVTHESIQKYFPEKQLKISLPNAIDKYGLSRGYQSSVFDRALGREPAVKPFRVLKSRRIPKDVAFDILKFHQHYKLCLSSAPDSQLDLEEYVLIFDQVLKFLLPLGSLFSWANTELNTTLEAMEKCIFGPSSKFYETAEKMLVFETSPEFKQSAKVAVGCKTFTRLHRTFVFVSLVIEKLIALDEKETTYYAFKSSYNATLASYHSWLTQKGAAISFYYLPNKKDLYLKYEYDIEIKEIDSIFGDILTKAKHIIKHCENLFTVYKLSEYT